jgi:hypothetical protein
MKRLALFLLVAATAGWSFCNAEDGSVQGESKDYASPRTVVEPSVPRRAVQPSHLARKYRVWHFSKDWRSSYYTHANRIPWWPNAPGG